MLPFELSTPLLAIESSCDDTACAILSPAGDVLAELTVCQTEHEVMGGVVPEIAARSHLALLPEIVDSVIKKAGVSLAEMGAFAASVGPGLIGGLIVGSAYAKGLAIARHRPFIAVNHIEAHALSVRLPKQDFKPATFPYLMVLVSGGHCQCVAVRGRRHYERLGGTLDDAVGEAFDKVAKLLGLGWPGGAALERLAQLGNPTAFTLPRPLLNRPGCDFSFSGSKTAVARIVAPYDRAPLPMQVAADLAASFQKSVGDVFVDRVQNALEMMGDAACLAVAGGVAANASLRERLSQLAGKHAIPFVAPPMKLCTDNAVMVGWAALEALEFHAERGEGLADGVSTAPRPRWPLSELSAR